MELLTNTNMLKKLFLSLLLTTLTIAAMGGERYNFNAQWKLALGDDQARAMVKHNDSQWQSVTLPYAFNQHEAYSRNCSELSDTVMWYRKHFILPKTAKGQRVYVEFEGARFGATVFINGHELGTCDNGVMAFGFDLTPYIIYNKENILAVRVDNSWNYHEKSSGSTFQWNNKNFYCNYGGINKNVWLHIKPQVHQTLPLYSNLGTTGVYVYPVFAEGGRTNDATVVVEAQCVNTTKKAQDVQHRVVILDLDGKEVASFDGEHRTIAAGDTVTLKAQKALTDLHLWSWGYGYLYTVKSIIATKGMEDCTVIRTGFRKTAFKDGMFYLNDRVLQLKGFAQRSTNEWPAVGISIPAWMTDYSNRLVLECNGNFYRWMHVTPSKQDVESFDRLGLIQAMPAGDAEKDVNDRRWMQRCELMRDAIIYNRNNPSVIFYEGGNNQISEEHMADLKAVYDQYDPNGGRAIGCRNMLDSKVAQYGGEMLYVNKSATKPMWQMEYNRDEGIRRYWDEWSFPYHKEGDGPMYRGDAHVVAYNHNQDGLAKENIIRWNEYWLARPGTGRRVNSGGAKIIFSDSNTHARGEKNYRTSGVVDAMRIPKDSYYVLQTMWDGWVDTEQDHTYIIGHWNYSPLSASSRSEEAASPSSAPAAIPAIVPKASASGSAASSAPATVIKPLFVCSTGDEVELFLKPQGESSWQSLGKGRRSDTFLFTFDSIRFTPGTLRAVSYRLAADGTRTAVSEAEKHTVDEAVGLRMKFVGNSTNMRADGADLRIIELEAIDVNGDRCPLAANSLHFEVEGEGTYLGGISGVVKEEERLLNEAMTKAHDEGREIQITGASAREGHSTDDNAILSHDLQLEAGVCRVLVRSTTTAGEITLHATCDGLPDGKLTFRSIACPVKDGFYESELNGTPTAKPLPSYLDRGETPATPSYTLKYRDVAVKTIDVAVNSSKAPNMTDDNEASKWSSDGHLENAWVKVTLEKPAMIRNISLRMDGFRTTSYPLQVIAYTTDSTPVVIWQGYTPKNLGNCYLDITAPVLTDRYEIRMLGEATVKEAFGSMTELAAKKNVSTAASKSNVLSIIEMEWNE